MTTSELPNLATPETAVAPYSTRSRLVSFRNNNVPRRYVYRIWGRSIRRQITEDFANRVSIKFR
jgi:hypothetical protein